MREHHVLYFSAKESHIAGFNEWAFKHKECRDFIHVIESKRDWSSPLRAEDLAGIISQLKDIDNLYVIIDYLSFFTNLSELQEAADAIRRTILQFPEVDFLFDQSGVPDDWVNGMEFILEQPRESSDCQKILYGFHIFDKNIEHPFYFAVLDYDNLFDGTNLRWAVRTVYYEKLNAKANNFSKIQLHRSDNLAYVIDDEQRQSRFNSIALYSCGYRVIPVHTAKMLLTLNRGILKTSLYEPKLIIRDFDLQFPDAEAKRDYEVEENKEQENEKSIIYFYYNVPEWNNDWKITLHNKLEIPNIDGYDKMIDYIRNYRYYEDGNPHWKMAPYNNLIFWKDSHTNQPILQYVITNGHDHLKFSHKHTYTPIQLIKKDEDIEVSGLQKPISGLYHPFFTGFLDEKGNRIVEQSFNMTRYGLKDLKEYEIDKRRLNHNHGVPVNIYGTVDEMLHRANDYYEKAHYVKSAVLAQETIELLNGFHWQMMIQAYQIKAKAENAIAMDMVGADEEKLVLDALLRIEMVKQDINRMVFPLFKDKNLKDQIKRRKKEHQLLEYIYSDCRKACHDNEYFDVEAVYISAMAHLDEYDFGIKDIKRYLVHRWFLWKRKKMTKKETKYGD